MKLFMSFTTHISLCSSSTMLLRCDPYMLLAGAEEGCGSLNNFGGCCPLEAPKGHLLYRGFPKVSIPLWRPIAMV